jgi:hypothetical protein
VTSFQGSPLTHWFSCCVQELYNVTIRPGSIHAVPRNVPVPTPSPTPSPHHHDGPSIDYKLLEVYLPVACVITLGLALLLARAIVRRKASTTASPEESSIVDGPNLEAGLTAVASSDTVCEAV